MTSASSIILWNVIPRPRAWASLDSSWECQVHPRPGESLGILTRFPREFTHTLKLEKHKSTSDEKSKIGWMYYGFTVLSRPMDTWKGKSTLRQKVDRWLPMAGAEVRRKGGGALMQMSFFLGGWKCSKNGFWWKLYNSEYTENHLDRRIAWYVTCISRKLKTRNKSPQESWKHQTENSWFPLQKRPLVEPDVEGHLQ